MYDLTGPLLDLVTAVPALAPGGSAAGVRACCAGGAPRLPGLYPDARNSALTSGAFLVHGAGQQLTDLAGDLGADRLHLAPEALDLGA